MTTIAQLMQDAEDAAWALARLAKARVKAHQRKLKDGRTVAVKEHERKDLHPRDALRRAVVHAVVSHGHPMPFGDLAPRLPRKHRNVDPAELEDAVADLVERGLLSPTDATGTHFVPGYRTPDEPPPAPKTADSNAEMRFLYDTCKALADEWLGATHPEARRLLERAMMRVGMQPVGTVGERVAFDGRHHHDRSGSLFPGDEAHVHRPGWHLSRGVKSMPIEKMMVGPSAPTMDAPMGGGSEPAPSLDSRVRAAIRALTEFRGHFINIADVRARLGDAPREAVDAALVRLHEARVINMIPNEDLKTITDRDRASAIRLGSRDRHLLVID
jgi:hypothetical protein